MYAAEPGCLPAGMEQRQRLVLATVLAAGGVCCGAALVLSRQQRLKVSRAA